MKFFVLVFHTGSLVRTSHGHIFLIFRWYVCTSRSFWMAIFVADRKTILCVKRRTHVKQKCERKMSKQNKTRKMTFEDPLFDTTLWSIWNAHTRALSEKEHIFQDCNIFTKHAYPFGGKGFFFFFKRLLWFCWHRANSKCSNRITHGEKWNFMNAEKKWAFIFACVLHKGNETNDRQKKRFH